MTFVYSLYETSSQSSSNFNQVKPNYVKRKLVIQLKFCYLQDMFVIAVAVSCIEILILRDSLVYSHELCLWAAGGSGFYRERDQPGGEFKSKTM